MAELRGRGIAPNVLFLFLKVKTRIWPTWNFLERSCAGPVDAALVQTSTTHLSPGPLIEQAGALCLRVHGLWRTGTTLAGAAIDRSPSGVAGYRHSGDDVGGNLVFDEGDAVAEHQFALFQ